MFTSYKLTQEIDIIVNKGRITIAIYLPVFPFDKVAFESQGNLTRYMCRELQAGAHLMTRLITEAYACVHH